MRAKAAVEGSGAPALRVVVVAPAVDSGLDRRRVERENAAMDPVIAALAQLVRDRYERELTEKAARRGRLRVVEGRSA
jgi:hypothetical protein